MARATRSTSCWSTISRRKLLTLRGDPRRARREPDQGAAPAREALEHLLQATRSPSCWSTSACRSSTASSWPTMIRAASALPADRDHLRLRRAPDRPRPPARATQSGAVDYVPVPVVPEILRAKVGVFAELYRKTRELERLNRELEQRVAERTAELEASSAQQASSPSSCARPTGARTSSSRMLAHELRNPLAPIRNAVEHHARRRTSTTRAAAGAATSSSARSTS